MENSSTHRGIVPFFWSSYHAIRWSDCQVTEQNGKEHYFLILLHNPRQTLLQSILLLMKLIFTQIISSLDHIGLIFCQTRLVFPPTRLIFAEWSQTLAQCSKLHQIRYLWLNFTKAVQKSLNFRLIDVGTLLSWDSHILRRVLDMDLKLPRWETSEDEIQTAPILGKIKTVLGGKLRVGINHVKLGRAPESCNTKTKSKKCWNRTIQTRICCVIFISSL